jgi:hypothetical protein
MIGSKMRRNKFARVMFLLFSLCTAAGAQAPTTIQVRWDWFVVSTPDFVGPFRGDSPGFKAPVPKAPLPKTLPLANGGTILGQFEVVVTLAGRTTFEQTLNVSSQDVASKPKKALKDWRFVPASLDAKSIRVRLRVQLHGN